MDIFEIIKKRRSIRVYKPNQIPQEKMNQVLEAARLAPSAHNGQPWKFLVIKDDVIKKKLVESAVEQMFILKAPVLIVACALTDKFYGGKMGGYLESWAIDVSIAMDHLVLAATSLGLATCWIGAFREKQAKEILGLGEGTRVVAMTPLGFPGEEGKDKGRKGLDEIVEWR